MFVFVLVMFFCVCVFSWVRLHDVKCYVGFKCLRKVQNDPKVLSRLYILVLMFVTHFIYCLNLIVQMADTSSYSLKR